MAAGDDNRAAHRAQQWILFFPNGVPMHTTIAAFEDRATARRAVERLAEAGFSRDDMHLQEAPSASTVADDPNDRIVGERTMESPEREIAVDRDALTAIGHFFVSLFGLDHPAGHADTYSKAVHGGRSVVCVEAEDDVRADKAAALLREMGGADVNRVERSDQPRLRDIVAGRQVSPPPP
jgi:hypothetical protein